MADHVMTRAQAFEYVARLGASVFTRKAPPVWPAGVEVVDVEDIADALHDFTRTIVGAFDDVPQMVSEDLVVQEKVRCELDRIFCELTIELEKAVREMIATCRRAS